MPYTSPAGSESTSAAVAPVATTMDTAAQNQQQAKPSVQSDNSVHNGSPQAAADCARTGTEQAAFVRPAAKEADGTPSVEARSTCEPAHCQPQRNCQASLTSGHKQQRSADGNSDSSTCSLRNRRRLERAGHDRQISGTAPSLDGQVKLKENCSLCSTVSLDRKDSSDKSTVL